MIYNSIANLSAIHTRTVTKDPNHNIIKKLFPSKATTSWSQVTLVAEKLLSVVSVNARKPPSPYHTIAIDRSPVRGRQQHSALALRAVTIIIYNHSLASKSRRAT